MTLNAQYDSIAAGYKQTKQSPLREHVEAYTFMRMLGELHGMTVLDLACGEGFYTRRIRQLGAASVTGVDISAEMIALAREAEATDALGIEYICADAATLQSPVRYDLVGAAYLLHYASDVTELRAMCESIAGCLKPGGRFVAINENPDQSADDYAAYTQYGFNKKFARPRADASTIEYSMIAGREVIGFSAYFYTRDTYEQALRDAGFNSIRWVPLELAPAGVDAMGDEYWRAYMDNPPVVGLEAVL